MIHRIRMWLWERRRKALQDDLDGATAEMRKASAVYRHAQNYTSYAVWECFNTEVTDLTIALAHHESRRPKP